MVGHGASSPNADAVGATDDDGPAEEGALDEVLDGGTVDDGDGVRAGEDGAALDGATDDGAVACAAANCATVMVEASTTPATSK